MDQLRTALVWLKRHHFWVLCGLVAIIAFGTQLQFVKRIPEAQGRVLQTLAAQPGALLNAHAFPQQRRQFEFVKAFRDLFALLNGDEAGPVVEHDGRAEKTLRPLCPDLFGERIERPLFHRRDG